MTPDSIKKSFQATGVWPMDAEVILKRFNNTTTRAAEASKIAGGFIALSTNAKRATSSRKRRAARRARHQNKTPKKSYPLDLQQPEQHHGGATFWSPRKIHEAREREATKQHEAEQLQLQKTEMKELKAASIIYKKKLAEEAKAERQRAKQARDAARKASADERIKSRALKQQQRAAATSQKAGDTHKKGKRAASSTRISKISRRHRVVDAG
ncbi:hypothetical protein A1F96_10258, partial [Pyrenophora tritici-repentis]